MEEIPHYDTINDFLSILQKSAFECALKIEKYANEKHAFVLSKEEMTYLIVHIERVTQSILEK